MTTAAQVGMANLADAYVPATLRELGQSVDPVAQLRPQALAGAQSLDGLTYGDMDALLYGSVVKARAAKTDSLIARLAIGGQHLESLVHTQVSDAGKQAASVAMTTRKGVSYVRMVNPPCCKRCAVLAGKYSAPKAFPRHPGCDCMAIPTTVAHPDEPLGQNISLDQIKDLSRAERQALAEGADLSRVVNAGRGRSKDGFTTTELKPKRGQRLTPEGIYRVSATREEAVQRLRENGYIR